MSLRKRFVDNLLSLLDDGSTGGDAAITGLSIEPNLSGLVLMEFVADAGTININTGVAPVIDRLTTVFDVQRIYDGDDLYATPLTTMAVNLAQANADKGLPYAGNGDDTLTLNTSGTFTFSTPIVDGTSNNCSHLAAIDSSGTVVNTWAPAANDDVFAITVSGSTVYVGGNFSAIDGNARKSVAAIGTDGSLTGWDPSLTGGGYNVYDIALSAGIVYAVGDFTAVGGTARNRAAAINTNATGTLASLNPNLDNDNFTQFAVAYAVDAHDGKVYLGGKFTTQGGTLSPVLANVTQ